MTRLTEMSNRDISRMYRTGSIYSAPASTAKYGGIINLRNAAPHNGKNIAIQAKPIAPLADYETWYRGRNRRCGSKCTAAKLRRIVIMRRQGSTWKECGDAVGVVGAAAKEWVEFLPFELSI
jgi:hypothetical protein